MLKQTPWERRNQVQITSCAKVEITPNKWRLKAGKTMVLTFRTLRNAITEAAKSDFAHYETVIRKLRKSGSSVARGRCSGAVRYCCPPGSGVLADRCRQVSRQAGGAPTARAYW